MNSASYYAEPMRPRRLYHSLHVFLLPRKRKRNIKEVGCVAKAQTGPGHKTSDDLGFTLLHRHMTAGFPGYEWDKTNFDCEKELTSAVVKLKEIKSLRMSSFVDPRPIELDSATKFEAECVYKSGYRPDFGPHRIGNL